MAISGWLVTVLTLLPIGGAAQHPDEPSFGSLASREDLRPVNAAGAVIARIRAAGPAAVAGLRAGDRVIALDGVVPRDLTDVRIQIQDRESVVVDLERDGRRVSKR